MVYEEYLDVSLFDLERYNKYLAIGNLECEDYNYLKEIGAEQYDDEEVGYVDFEDGTSFYLNIVSDKFTYMMKPVFYVSDVETLTQVIYSNAKIEGGYKIYYNDNTYIVNVGF